MNKNIKKILLIKAVLFLFAGSSFSQNDTLSIKAQTNRFAPVGAQWYYETQSHFSTGYLKMEVEKDTVINGVDCIKLLRERHWHDLMFDELHDSMLPPLFLSQAGDVVMVYHKDSFSKLFDFGAGIGNSWMVPGQEGVCEEDFGSVRVVGKGVEIHNGIELKYVLLVDESFSYWGFSPTFPEEPSDTIKVLERIGPIGSYLLPEQKCLFDDAEGGPLRCYIDDELEELHLASLYPDRDCDYISEQYQQVYDEQEPSFFETKGLIATVTPNPASTWAVLDYTLPANKNSAVLNMTNVLGVLVMSVELDGNHGQKPLDIRNLTGGVYTYTIHCGDYMKTGKLVIAK